MAASANAKNNVFFIYEFLNEVANIVKIIAKKFRFEIFHVLFQPLNGLQTMRVLVLLLVEDSRLVKEVDTHLSRGVDDLFVAHHDAYMGDATVLVAEESQVAGLGLLQEIHQFATGDLLVGVAGEEESAQAGADLRQA